MKQKNIKKKIVSFLGAGFFALMAVSLLIPAKCLAASNVNKALQAYDQFLKAEQDDYAKKGWSPASFCIAYIDADSVPELYYGRALYTYKGGRVVSVTYADSAYPNFVGYYEKTGVVLLREGNAGGSYNSRYEWIRDYYGILNNTQVQSPVLTYYYSKSGSADTDLDKIPPEAEEYKLNGQTVSKSSFDSKLKQLSNGKRLITFEGSNLHENTEKNRANFLKAGKQSASPKKMSAPSVKSPKKKQIKVSWKKQSKVSGYRIQYSYKKKFGSAKTKKVGKGKTKLVITGLKSGKTCYVRIQAYLKKNGKRYYGKWSAARKIKIK